MEKNSAFKHHLDDNIFREKYFSGNFSKWQTYFWEPSSGAAVHPSSATVGAKNGRNKIKFNEFRVRDEK